MFVLLGKIMSKVIFKFDIWKDAKNYWQSANSDAKWGHDFSKGVRPNILKMLKGKEWEKTKTEIHSLLKKNYDNDKKKLLKKLREISEKWGKIEKKYFRRLLKITGNRIYAKEFTVFMTTTGRCPYFPKQNAFMVSIFGSNLDEKMLIIAHELMHLQFHHYYEKKLLKRISKKMFNDIKESLTVLLNLEFKGLHLSKDRGYPSHAKLREFMTKEWKENKDFDMLVSKSIKLLKKN